MTEGATPRAAALELAGPEIDRFLDTWVYDYNAFLYPFPFLPTSSPYASVAEPRPGEHRLTIAYSSRAQSYLEACGCKLSMSGGVARRAAFLKQLREDVPGLLTVDLGGYFPRPDGSGEPDHLSQKEMSFYLECMSSMHYDAAVVGATEVLHGPSFFRRVSNHSQTPPILTSDIDANLGSDPIRWTLVNGIRVAVVGATGDPTRQTYSRYYDREIADLTYLGAQGIAAAVLEARSQKPDLVLLAGRVTAALLDELVELTAAPDVVLDNKAEPLWEDPTGARPPLWVGDYRGVMVAREPFGSYGMSTLHVGWAESGEIRARFETHELMETMDEDPHIRNALDSFYASLRTDELARTSFEPLFQWDPTTSRHPFVGDKQCVSCHSAQHVQWRTTGHADAMRTLVVNHRNFNPKCVNCHVTGMGYEGGYEITGVGHAMENVQCEVCHGPGSAHVQDPLVHGMRRSPEKGICLECHNEQHSDFFEQRFEEAYEAVSH